MHINDFSEKFQGGIDPAKLENVKHLGGGGIRAACPACRVAGSDKSGDHLLIQANGKFGCAANPDDHQHRKEIFRLVGMTTGDAGRNGSTKKVVASYDYSDKDGKVLYQVVRYEGKKFIQRRADPDRPGQWIEGTGCMKGVRLMLYRLPEVLKAKADGKRVVISEGEKDCDRLAKEGFTATCNVGGASKKSGDKKWLPQYTETLTGMDVVIIADKDDDGRKHAAIVAGDLHGKAKSVKQLELPDVNGKPVKDATDYFNAGGTVEDFITQVDATPEWTPANKVETSAAEIVASKDETEFEFANRLAVTLPPIKTCGSTWHAYAQGAWYKTERASFRPKAQAILPESIRTARREATLLDHLEGRNQFNESDFAGFYKFAPGGEILVNVANGVLSVQPNGKTELLDHSPDFLFSLRVAAMFNPKAACPLFRRVLGELLPDAEDQKLLQLFSGYMLLPDCRFEAALISYGEAGRGKSTVAEAIANALGVDLVTRLSMSQVCDPKSYHVPKLRHVAVNLATELDTVELGDSGVFKAIVSGEAIEARPIYGSPFTMRPLCKLMFLANSLPRFRHGTEAELRRSRFLRFDVLPAEKDTTLKSKLATERDGIFLWMVEGLKELLALPEMPIGGRASRNVHDRFRISNDPVGAFVTLRCQLSPDAKSSKDELRNAFADFCERHELPASCGDWFLKSLYERWPQLRETRLSDANGDRYRAVAGIALRK